MAKKHVCLSCRVNLRYDTLDHREHRGAPVLARVEWHPPDFIKNYVHRGVSLFEPAATS